MEESEIREDLFIIVYLRRQMFVIQLLSERSPDICSSIQDMSNVLDFYSIQFCKYTLSTATIFNGCSLECDI